MVNSLTGEIKIHTNLKILEIYDTEYTIDKPQSNPESIYQF